MVNEAAELVELLVDGARAGDLDGVKAALDEGVDVNAADEYGRTGGHLPTAGLLLVALAGYDGSWRFPKADYYRLVSR